MKEGIDYRGIGEEKALFLQLFEGGLGMQTLLLTHPLCLEHDTGYGHPECSERLRVILESCGSLDSLEWGEASRVGMEQLAYVHDREYIERIFALVPSRGLRYLNADTLVSSVSGDAALYAAGAVCMGVDYVMSGTSRCVFCAVRPPGHHAMPDEAMGFCLFNNIAIGALYACRVYGLSRVAVIDFDVHHGNGTQAMFEADERLFYASSHQWPLFPGTGREYERGLYENIINVTLPPMTGSLFFRECFEGGIVLAVDEFAPELLLISAGFDGHAADPLAQVYLYEDDYAWITRQLVLLAQKHCQGRLVSTLEGGYDLAALAASCLTHIQTLIEA